MPILCVDGRNGRPPHEEDSTVNLSVLAAWIRAKVSADTERGATMVEYALLVGLIGVALIAAVNFLSSEVDTSLREVGSAVN